MDNFDPLNPEKWSSETLRCITFLQFQMSRLSDSEENAIASKRYGHALSCLLTHFKCRVGSRAPFVTNSQECATEYARLINIERSARAKGIDVEVQTSKEQPVEHNHTATQTTPATLKVPITAIDTVGLPPPRNYFEGIEFDLWEPVSALHPSSPPAPVPTPPVPVPTPPVPVPTLPAPVPTPPSPVPTPNLSPPSPSTCPSKEEEGDNEVVEIKVCRSKEKKNLCVICKKPVYYLMRHLQIKHGLQGKCRRHLMESKRSDKTIGTNKNPARVCPFDDCKEVVVRLDRHLKSMHQIDKETDKDRYLSILASAEKCEVKTQPKEVNAKEEEEESEVQVIEVPKPAAKKRKAVAKAKAVKVKGKEKKKPKRDLNSETPSESSESPSSCSWSDTSGSSASEIDEVDDSSSSSVEDKERKETVEEKSPLNKSLSSLLDGYLIFKQTPHGGDLNTAQAKSDTARVKSICSAICNRTDATLLDLFGDADLVWNSFFRENREGDNPAMAGTTMKGYSRSLEDFVNWLLDHNLRQLSMQENVALSKLSSLQFSWRKTLRKDCAKQRNKQVVRDKKNQLTLPEVKAILESEHGRRCRTRLLALASETTPSRVTSVGEASQLREYVVSWLVVAFAARASLISNCRICEYKDCREAGKVDGFYELSVLTHKTASSNGPLTIYLDDLTMSLIVAYKRSVLPELLNGKENEHLFVTQLGTKVQSCRVSRLMAGFLKKTDVKLQAGKTFKSTTVRKMWVTHLKSKGATDDQLTDLAKLMKHSRRVQDAWYDLTLSGQQAKRACAVINKELSEAKASVPPPRPPSTPSPKKPAQHIDEDAPEAGATEELCESPHRKYHGTRYPWTDNDLQSLKVGMKHILRRPVFPRASEIEKVFVNGSTKVQDIWRRYDCADWHIKCIEKIRNMYKSKKK